LFSTSTFLFSYFSIVFLEARAAPEDFPSKDPDQRARMHRRTMVEPGILGEDGLAMSVDDLEVYPKERVEVAMRPLAEVVPH